MQLDDYLRLENVAIGLSSKSKCELYRHLSLLGSKATGSPVETISVALRHHEQNGIGNGVALLHGELRDIEAPICLVVRMEHPVDIDAPDTNPVNLIFVLFTPSQWGANRLNVLACVARRLRDDQTVLALRSAMSVEEIFLTLTAAISDHSNAVTIERSSVSIAGSA
jgi:PTS system nitrogen regulatory IIA component